MWGPIVFMALIVFFLWRTMQLMPKTKPQEIKPDSARLDQVGRRRRRRRGQGRAAGGRRLPARPEALQGARRQGPQGHPPARPARHGQDAAGQGGRQRVRRAVLRPVGVELRRDVRRPRRRAHPAAVRARRASTRRRSSSSTRSTPSAPVRGSDNNSEREQTLNQLLVEMDGFAATRRARRDRRVQPAREARPGAAAPRPLRPPDPRLAARRQRAARRS